MGHMLVMATQARPRAAASFLLVLLASAVGHAQAQTPATPVPLMTPPGPSASASPSPLPTATQAAENPLVTERVRREFSAWQRGRIDRRTYSPEAGGTYIDAFIALVSPDLAAIGALQTVQYRGASLLLNDLVYRYDLTGSAGAVSVLYALDQRGRTDGIVFTPLVFRTASP